VGARGEPNAQTVAEKPVGSMPASTSKELPAHASHACASHFAALHDRFNECRRTTSIPPNSDDLPATPRDRPAAPRTAIRVLEARKGQSRSDVRSPDKEGDPAPIELTCRITSPPVCVSVLVFWNVVAPPIVRPETVVVPSAYRMCEPLVVAPAKSSTPVRLRLPPDRFSVAPDPALNVSA
jgi:hypothetical protein